MFEVKWISTTIKRKWLDPILSGEKKFESKVANEFWTLRLEKLMGEDDVGLCLVCGRDVHKFKVVSVTKHHDDQPINIDGWLTRDWFEIEIGEEIK